jgi:hypothetical protein
MTVVTVAVAGGYRVRPEYLIVITRRAKPAKLLESRTSARLYLCDTLLERLPQDLQDVAAELGPFIQEEHPVVSQRDLARHRHVPPADQSRVRDGVVRGAKWAGRDPRRAVAGAAGDAVNPRGLKGLGEGHGRQNGGEAPGQHRRARPRRAKEEDVVGRTLASISVLPLARERQPPGDPKLGRAWVIVCK